MEVAGNTAPPVVAELTEVVLSRVGAANDEASVPETCSFTVAPAANVAMRHVRAEHPARR